MKPPKQISILFRQIFSQLEIHSLSWQILWNNIILKKFIYNNHIITFLSLYHILSAKTQENGESLETISRIIETIKTKIFILFKKPLWYLQEELETFYLFFNSLTLRIFSILLYYIQNPINKDVIINRKCQQISITSDLRICWVNMTLPPPPW